MIFLLDTNVLSALMSVRPRSAVAVWVSAQPNELLFTAAVCQAEILTGIAMLPEGRRRVALETAARAIFEDDFYGRIISFDDETAKAYAEIFAARRRAGQSVATIDLMISVIAQVHRLPSLPETGRTSKASASRSLIPGPRSDGSWAGCRRRSHRTTWI